MLSQVQSYNAQATVPFQAAFNAPVLRATSQAAASPVAVGPEQNAAQSLMPQSDPMGDLVNMMPDLVKSMFNGVIRLFDHMAKAFMGMFGLSQGTAASATSGTAAAATSPVSPAPSIVGAPIEKPIAGELPPGVISEQPTSVFDKVETIWEQGKELFGSVKDLLGGFLPSGDLISKGIEKVGEFASKIPGVGGLIGKGAELLSKIF